MSEFELIQRFFSGHQPPAACIPLGIGDDCALMSPRPGMQLAISTDTLVEGRHFFANANPRMLGYKSLAVNLSDLAAMGAEPRAFTLALTLPEVRTDWLQDFSEGLFSLASQSGCQLIGGDTTRGPLNIGMTVFGEVPAGVALRRDAARPGDDIWISGTLGDARLALACLLNQCVLSDSDFSALAVRLHMPTPRIALGLALRDYANAAIDLSDGLIGDLAHILKRSGCGATVWCDALPVGELLKMQNKAMQYEFALAGGDDYELCFTAPHMHRDAIAAVACQTQIDTQITRIGFIESGSGCRFVDANNHPLNFAFKSFDHFQL